MAHPAMPDPQEEVAARESQEPPEADVVEWGSGMLVYSGSESTDEWMKVDKESLVTLDDWR